MIPHNKVITTAEDRGMIERVIASGQLAQGPEVEALEADMCAYTGRPYAIAVSSGTEAIRLALLAYEGRAITVPAYSCVALANAALAVSDRVHTAADVLPGTWTIDPDEVGHDIDPDVVVAVNTFGVKADVLAIKATGAKVIEDCTHGFGDHWSDVEVLSFHATKLLGGAGGGMILTGDKDLAGFLRDLRDYDDKEPNRHRLNSKMTDIHAALVRSKLRRLDSLIEERRNIAELYLGQFRDIAMPGRTAAPTPGRICLPEEEDGRAWYRFVIEVDDAERYFRRLEQFNIRALPPIDNWLAKAEPPITEDSAPVSYRAYRSLVSLPCYPGLTKPEVLRIARCVHEVASELRQAA